MIGDIANAPDVIKERSDAARTLTIWRVKKGDEIR
jgi:hypothetical protein